MKEIKYEKELFIPHKKFTLEELAKLGVKPSSQSSLTSERYILCEYEYEHKTLSLDNYYSEDHMYHAVYDTQNNEFVMFNEDTKSEMGPWLSLTDDQEVGIPGLNVVCYYNYDYDSMEDENGVWWNEGVLYGVFDDEGNIYRGTLYNDNGQLNIIETKNFIRFDDVARDGSEWYKDNADWIVVNGKLTCVKNLGEDANVYSVIDYANPQNGAENEDKVLYVIWEAEKNGVVFYAIDSQTGKKSKAYTSYQNLILSEQLYKLSADGKSRIYPARALPENTESILRHPLPIREHSKYYVQKATNNGYKTMETTLELVDYNTANDYYIFYDEAKKAYFLRFLENNNQSELDIQLPADTDFSKPISLETLVEKNPYNFAKLPTFEFGSRENIEKYLGAIEKYFARKNPFNEQGVLDHDAAELYEEEFETISLMIKEKLASELAKIEKQEQECWDAKEAEEPKDPNYDSSLQDCIDRERIERKLKESKERNARRNKKAQGDDSQSSEEIKTYGEDNV